MSQRKKIVLISASPKADQEWAVSEYLAKRGQSSIDEHGINTVPIQVRHALTHRETERAFGQMQSADALIVIFPLYFFCMPGMLTRFLQDFAARYPACDHPAVVYAIINCGFPEAQINTEAMRVVEQFAAQTARAFGGGVMIGTGGMILAAQNAPFMKRVMQPIDELFDRVCANLLSEKPVTDTVIPAAIKFPRWLYFFASTLGWNSMSRKNHLVKRDLYRRPYEIE